MEQIKAFYYNSRWGKILALLGLVLAAVVLLVISDGFPPWAWRFLITQLPLLPRLWAVQGGAILPSLIGLILLSLSLLLAWGTIAVLFYKVLVQWWQDYHARQNFQLDLQEAERLAEQNLAAADEGADLSWLFGSSPDQPALANGADKMDRAEQPLMRYNCSYQRQPVTPAHPAAAPQLDFPSAEPSVSPYVPNPVSPLPAAQVSRQQTRPAARQEIVRSPSPSVSQQTTSPIPATAAFAPRPAPAAQAGTWQSPVAPTASAPTPRSNAVPARPSPIWEPEENEPSTTQPARRASSPIRPQLRVVPPPSFNFDEEMEFELDTSQSDKNTSDYRADFLTEPSTSAREADIAMQTTRPDWLAQLEALIANKAPQTPVLPLETASPAATPIDRVPPHSPVPPVESSPSRLPQDDEAPGQRHPVQTDDLDEQQVQKTFDLETTLPLRREDQEALRRPADDVRTDPLPGDDDEAHEVPVRLVAGIGLDPGIVRKKHPNEDSLFAIQGLRISDDRAVPAGLFVVADGMGGHANGREASKLAIQTVSDAIIPTLLREADGTSIIDDEQLFMKLLKDGVQGANLAIYQRNQEMPKMMGTTITAALVVDSTAYIANVGDSRTYIYRAGEGLRQVTRDHSRVADMVALGLITPDEIYTHPQRNQIHRCLGERATAKVDTFVEYVQPDDILLLCSDGLWEMVRDPDIERIIAASAHNPAQISAVLVQAALHGGGADNISVVVVGIVKGVD